MRPKAQSINFQATVFITSTEVTLLRLCQGIPPFFFLPENIRETSCFLFSEGGGGEGGGVLKENIT